MIVIVYNRDGKFKKYEAITNIKESSRNGGITFFELISNKNIVDRFAANFIKLEVV